MQHAPADIRVTDWSPLASRFDHIPEGMHIAVCAQDLASGSTLEYEADRVILSASTIKTLILVAIARALDAGSLALDDPITVSESMRIPGSGVLNWLHEGITLPLKDHAWLMIAISDNTASNALIEAAGLENIRALATELGVPSLDLQRPFLGHNADENPLRNTVTARGLTTLLAAIWNDTAASPERCAWMRRLHADQQHRARLPRHLPEGIDYAGKTGSLTGISHDCGVISGPSGAIAITALVESTVSKYDDDAFIGSLGQAVAEIVS